MLTPTGVDLWVARQLGSRLGRHELLDLAVQSGITHGILGGACFGAVLSFWLFALKADDEEPQRKFEITIVASIVAVLLAELAAQIVQWPAPNKYGDLAALFPESIMRSEAGNCFPSHSTAVYGAIASGVFSWRRRVGAVLWVAVALLVALPRMYVGGHFLTDVLVGAACAIAGYELARLLVRQHRLPAVIHSSGLSQWVISVAVFIYVWQVSVEFREVTWFINSLRLFIR